MRVRSVLKKAGFPVLCGILCFLLAGCGAPEGSGPVPGAAVSPAPGETGAGAAQVRAEESAAPSGIQVFLDEELWSGDPGAGVSAEDLTVYITHGGELLISLPFSENHIVTVRQPDGSENTVMLTGSLVRMMDANCSNHDCVDMGEVTRENLAGRILGGFIVCLPHEIIVEVREP